MGLSPFTNILIVGYLLRGSVVRIKRRGLVQKNHHAPIRQTDTRDKKIDPFQSHPYRKRTKSAIPCFKPVPQKQSGKPGSQTLDRGRKMRLYPHIAKDQKQRQTVF